MSHFGRAGPPDIRDTYSLLVLNITFRTTPDDLYPLFDRYGKVVDIFIPRDRRSGESRGFAFVRYKHVDEAQKAVERLDGVDVDGRQIAVQFAKYGRNDEKMRSRSRSPRRIRYRDDYGREYQEHRYRSRSRERYGRERERERSREGYRYDDNRSREAAYGRDRYERERPRERDAYDRDRSRDVYERDRSREAYDRDRSREVFERERGREMYDRDRSGDRHDGRSRERYESERFVEAASAQVQRGSPPKRSLSPAVRMSPSRDRDVSRVRSGSPVHVDGATYDKRTGKSRSLEPRASPSPVGVALPEHGKSLSPGAQSPAPLNNGLEAHSPYNTDPDDA